MQDPTDTPIAQPNTMSRFPDAPPTPLIKHLPEPYRPNPSTSCETCPSAIFFQTLDGSTKCHCSTLNVISWSDKETNPVTECDGREIALMQQEQRAMRADQRQQEQALRKAEMAQKAAAREAEKARKAAEREAKRQAKEAAKAS